MDVARNGEKWERGVLSSSQHAWFTKVSEEEGKRRRDGGNRSLAGQQASSHPHQPGQYASRTLKRVEYFSFHAVSMQSSYSQ